MTVTASDLQTYVGGSAEDGTDYVGVVAAARALVDQHVGATIVPAAVLDQAVLEVGSKIASRRQLNGVGGFDSPGPSAPKDPMITVYQMLAPFLPAGFA